NGSGSWLAQRWVGGSTGRPVRLAFDRYPDLGLEDARMKAAALISEIAHNVDIVSRKHQIRMAQAEALHAAKLGETVAKFIELRKKPGRYWKELERTFERDVISAMGKETPVRTITKEQVQALLDAKLTKHPGAARTLYATLSPFFKFCVARDLIHFSPCAGIDIPRPAVERDRILNEQELKSFWLACDRLPVFGVFYRVLLLTAQRREEVAGMR